MIDSLKVPNRYFVTTLSSALTSENPCLLRVVLDSPPNRDTFSIQMPGHAKAIWGSVFHSMTEEIHSGRLMEEDLESTMRIRIEERLAKEEELGMPWATIDLQSTLSIFEIKRRCRRLENLRSELKTNKSLPSNSSGRVKTTGREVFVSGFEGRLTGLIDEVESSSSGVTIIDDKTGKILTEDGVKPSYIKQLTIYAALYQELGYADVKSIVLRDKSGSEIFSKTPKQIELTQTISELMELMNNIDYLVELKDIEKLAKPSCANCSLCPHRIVCNSHLEKMHSQRCEYPHPNLFLGTLVGIFNPRANTGKLKLTIRIDDNLFHANVNETWLSSDVEIDDEIFIHAYYLDTKSESLLRPRKHSHAVTKRTL